jgi:hypothetical protein
VVVPAAVVLHNLLTVADMVVLVARALWSFHTQVQPNSPVVQLPVLVAIPSIHLTVLVC